MCGKWKVWEARVTYQENMRWDFVMETFDPRSGKRFRTFPCEARQERPSQWSCGLPLVLRITTRFPHGLPCRPFRLSTVSRGFNRFLMLLFDMACRLLSNRFRDRNRTRVPSQPATEIARKGDLECQNCSNLMETASFLPSAKSSKQNFRREAGKKGKVQGVIRQGKARIAALRGSIFE